MTKYLKGWQCAGCGRIDAPATCIGVCQDRKVEVLSAAEHEAGLAALRERARCWGDRPRTRSR